MNTVPSISIRSAQRRYSVQIGTGLLSQIGRDKIVAGRRCFVVTSPRVLGLHGERLLRGFAAHAKPPMLLVPDGERNKTLTTVERLCNELAAAGAHRDSMLLALGGGMIGDITGFVAAIYQRGVDFIQIPTTVLAQVDASIGGKTGVNLAAGKNLVGSFRAPLCVFADMQTLQTLSDREFRAGLFESIKAGIIGDRTLFRLLERERDAVLARDEAMLLRVITRSVRLKAAIVQRDEHESGERMLLNFGHTLGHALESALGYKTLLHGEAVAYGMLAALRLSATTGAMQQGEADRAIALINSYGPLPRFNADADTVLGLSAKDKKHTQTAQRFVLASAIGSAFVVEGLAPAEIRASVQHVLQLAGARR